MKVAFVLTLLVLLVLISYWFFYLKDKTKIVYVNNYRNNLNAGPPVLTAGHGSAATGVSMEKIFFNK